MNESAIFTAALEKETGNRRRLFLDEACAGDEKLRQRVEALLQAHSQSDDILDAAGKNSATADFAPITEKAGSRIGPYRLMEQIGEGGFGVVFVAEQQEPVRRKVALKLIKPGMDSSQVIARFQAERQALAMMDHPNIARVLDAGATDTGRPYFVMELVRGIPITEYCDKNQLTPSERMEIFVTVCNAIQHAHQKGIIHRDIKPSNVLVTSHDGKPVAKVIDFGVAKAIHQQLTERTIYTQFAQMIGTPLYMSPEQAEMSGLDIDTRSDIYSLGVLLYELFTGSTPLEKSRLVTAAYDEVRRMIREDEPLMPSQRLSTSAALPSLAANRKTEPGRLSKLMKGELDWIVMRSLEKDRTRRYETASAFGADIGRYLRDEQVEACPPSATYRLRKFIRRNRFVFASSSFVAAALLLGVIVSTAFAIRLVKQGQVTQAALLTAEQLRNRAEELQRAQLLQREKAEQDRDKAIALSKELAIEKEELSRQKEVQRRMLYTSDMNLIQSAWDADNVSRVLDLLNAHRPQPGQSDLRGFEWHYWNRLCHSDLRTVKLRTKGLFGLESGGISSIFSPDGKQVVVHQPSIIGSAPSTKVLSVLDSETGVELHSLKIHTDAGYGVTNAAWHPNGTHLALPIVNMDGKAEMLMMWDIVANKTLFTINEQQFVRRPQYSFEVGRDMWFSSDGGRFACAVGKQVDDGPAQPVVKFWDSRTGEELAVIPLPSQRVAQVAISVDGSRIAYACDDDANKGVVSGEVIRILDVASREQAVTIPLAGPASFRFSPDGQRLFVSGSPTASSETVQEREGGVFDASTGERLFAVPDTASWSLSQWSPDGKWLAVESQSRPRSVKLYRTTGDRAPVEFRGHTNTVIALSFSPDSQRLLTAGQEGYIKTWDVAATASKPVRQPPATTLSPLLTVVSNDGKRIATAPTIGRSSRNTLQADSRKNVVTVCDDAGNVQHETAELIGPIGWLKFSADGRRLAACAVVQDGDLSTAAQLCVWDTASGAEQLTLRLPAALAGGARIGPTGEFSPDGSKLAAIFLLGRAGARTRFIKTWNIDLRREDWESETVQYQLGDLKFSPDGQRIVSGYAGSRTAVWEARNGQMLWNTHTGVWRPSFSADGKRIFGSVWEKRSRETSLEIKLWDVDSGRELQTIRERRLGSNSTRIVLSPNGRWLAAGGRYSGSSVVIVWDMSRQEREPFTLKGFISVGEMGIAFSPDSRRIATCTSAYSGGETKLWDVETGQELLTLRGGDRNIRFSANGRVLIAESENYSIGDIHVQRWDASRLSPQVEAELLVGVLASRRGAEPLPLVSEIRKQIDADQDLPEDTRVAAVAIIKALRRENELNEAAWAIAALPNQPRDQYERALHYLEEASTADPDNQESWSTRGLVHYRLGRSTEALTALARSRELLEKKMLALPAEDVTVMAMTQHQLGKVDEARVTLEQVRSSASRNETEWQKLLAEAETLLGIPQAADHPEQWIGRRIMPRRDARVEYEAGERAVPRRPYLITKVVNDRLWFGKNGNDSVARSQVVRVQDASRYYTNVLQAGPDGAAYRDRGEVSRVMGEYDQAIDDNSAAILLEPLNPNSFNNRGLAKLQGKHDLDQALADADRAIELISSQHPYNAWFHVTRGMVRQEQGELDDALKSFDKAIELDPDSGLAYVKRAGVWSAKGDHAKMQSDLDDAITRSPEDPETLAAKAWLLATSPNADHRNREQAVADAKKACELTGYRSPESLVPLAAAYAENDDFDQAVKRQKEALDLLPPAARKEDEARLELYKDRKAYHEPPASTAR